MSRDAVCNNDDNNDDWDNNNDLDNNDADANNTDDKSFDDVIKCRICLLNAVLIYFVRLFKRFSVNSGNKINAYSTASIVRFYCQQWTNVTKWQRSSLSL